MTAVPDLRQLECFFAVAEQSHFRRAAESLRLSPASVSELVAALERRLGSRLFDRSSRRVRLTEFGETFLNEVKDPYLQLRHAHTAARARSEQSISLVIAYTPELGELYLPAILEFGASRDEPRAHDLHLVLLNTADQLVAVANGTVDVGLCWSASVRPPLRSLPLLDVPICAVLQENDPLAGLSTVPLENLRGRSVVVTRRSDNPFTDNRLQTAFLWAGIPTGSVNEVDRFDELAVQVASRNWIGLHPATLILRNQIPGIAVRPVDPELTETICVLTGSAQHPDLGQLIAALSDATRDLHVPTLLPVGMGVGPHARHITLAVDSGLAHPRPQEGDHPDARQPLGGRPRRLKAAQN